jgi:hypothetical protein
MLDPADNRKGRRDKRLAEALKANLKRRKEQRRARSAPASAPETTKPKDMMAGAEPTVSRPDEPTKESG